MCEQFHVTSPYGGLSNYNAGDTSSVPGWAELLGPRATTLRSVHASTKISSGGNAGLTQPYTNKQVKVVIAINQGNEQLLIPL